MVTGRKCFDEDDCLNNPCKKGGTCTDEGNDFKCDCQQGWKGKTCQEIDYCSFKPCKNNGSCSNGDGVFKCQCKDQFEGPTCTESCKHYSHLYFELDGQAWLNCFLRYLLTKIQKVSKNTNLDTNTKPFLSSSKSMQENQAPRKTCIRLVHIVRQYEPKNMSYF